MPWGHERWNRREIGLIIKLYIPTTTATAATTTAPKKNRFELLRDKNRIGIRAGCGLIALFLHGIWWKCSKFFFSRPRFLHTATDLEQNEITAIISQRRQCRHRRRTHLLIKNAWNKYFFFSNSISFYRSLCCLLLRCGSSPISWHSLWSHRTIMSLMKWCFFSKSKNIHEKMLDFIRNKHTHTHRSFWFTVRATFCLPLSFHRILIHGFAAAFQISSHTHTTWEEVKEKLLVDQMTNQYQFKWILDYSFLLASSRSPDLYEWECFERVCNEHEGKWRRKEKIVISR